MKPRSKVDARFGTAPGDAEQRAQAGLQATLAHPRQTLGDQDAIVAVERYDVGDGAERDQVEQRAEVGFGVLRERATAAQFGTQRQHDVEHDADTGHGLAREVAARLVRIDDDIGIGAAFRPAGGDR